MIAALLAVTPPPVDTTTDPNHYYGTEIQGVAAGMWSTMPEWARAGICVILAAVLITGCVRVFSRVFFRVLALITAVAIVAVTLGKMHALYDWFRHLPFVNGEI